MNDHGAVRGGVCGGLLAIVCALTGCLSSAASSDAGVGGQGPAGGGGGGAPSTVEVDLLTPLVAAFCGAARACCSKGGFPIDSLADCEETRADHGFNEWLVSRGTVQIDGVALKGCVAAYRQVMTTCNLDDVLDACGKVFSGTQGEGQPCELAEECNQDQGLSTCVQLSPDDGTPVGVCKKLSHGNKGDNCIYTCGAGDPCLFTIGGPTMVPAVANTKVCFEEDGLYCELGEIGVCTPLIPTGQACPQGQPSLCGADSYCDSTCMKTSGPGQPCATGAVCATNLSCVDGVCTAFQGFASTTVCQGDPPAP